jgi:hypothetical protein
MNTASTRKMMVEISNTFLQALGSHDAAISAALARKVADADLGPLNDYVSA